MANLLSVLFAQEVMPLRPKRLQTGCTYISCDEGSREACLDLPLDPLQFVYQPHLGLKLHSSICCRAHTHLNGAGFILKIAFFYFPSEFNTIQPPAPREKLQTIMVDSLTVFWVTDFLTDKPQFVRRGVALMVGW